MHRAGKMGGKVAAACAGGASAMLRLAWRNVLRQRARSATALLAVALGVAAIVVAGGFVADVYIQFGEAIIHSQYGHLQIHRKGFAAYGTQRPAEYVVEDARQAISAVTTLPGTEIVLSRLRFAGVANAGGGDLPIVGEGIQPKLESQLGTYVQVVNGRALREEDRDVVMIGDGVAKALQVAPGQPLNVSIVTREGALNSLAFEVVGVFRSYSKDYDARAVRLPLRAAQDLMATPGVNEIVAVLRDTRATDSAARTLRERLAGTDFEVHTWRDLADFYTKTVQLFDREFGFLQAVLLLMIVLSVANTINTTAFERLPEFGTMLALGDRRRDVFGLIMMECLMLGIIGSAVGAVMGAALALVISAIGIPMPPPPNTDMGYTGLIRVVPATVAGAFVVGSIAAVLAGIAPSAKIARMPPVEALRRAR